MLGLLLFAQVAAAAPQVDRLRAADQALQAGRIDQARIMISAAVEQGASGPELERSLADLALASGRPGEALARYQQLLAGGLSDPKLLERAVEAAIGARNLTVAGALSARAVKAPSAGWRAWNARGVVADLTGDWTTADAAYQEALSKAPGQAEVLNNAGWSKLIRGEWTAALALLEQAAAAGGGKSPRVRNNLELARMALAADLPRRGAGESDEDWAARLNDAGVVAQLRGERAKAVAAFSRAIEARRSWYLRAANNLAWVGKQP